MNGYVKVVISLAALGVLALKFPLLKFAALPDAPPPAPAALAPAAVDAAVETVRAGSLPNHDSTKVGKAFEARFQNPRWSSFKTPNGVTTVDFRGTIEARVLNVAGLNSSKANSIVVRSNCILSLGLGRGMEQDATSARMSEQTFNSNLADLEQRQQNAPAGTRSQNVAQEHRSLVAARKQQEKSQLEADAATEAKIAACIASRPITVNFQFPMSDDQKQFRLGYIDKEPFGENAAEAVLGFVYAVAPGA